MAKEIDQMVNGFLRWYHDLYGDDWYTRQNPENVLQRQSSGPRGEPNMDALDQFCGEINTCQKCSLGKTRTKFVFGVGHPNADLMFVGEAPGRDEDLQGFPFVGRAGKLLNTMLEKVELQRSDVYIANILKCRPPNNRDPLPEEVSECIPYLHRQIEMIKPKVLIALGRIAAQNLLANKNTLKSMRRKIWQYQNIPLVVTFHPAYILRNMNAMDEGVADLQFVLSHYQSVKDS